MADYPAYPQDADSTWAASNTVQVERAADGTLRGRILSPDKHEGEIVHALTLAELAALKAWRLANLAAPVGFRWQGTGETYTVACFEPIQVRHLGPNLVLATVKLSEV